VKKAGKSSLITYFQRMRLQSQTSNFWRWLKHGKSNNRKFRRKVKKQKVQMNHRDKADCSMLIILSFYLAKEGTVMKAVFFNTWQSSVKWCSHYALLRTLVHMTQKFWCTRKNNGCWKWEVIQKSLCTHPLGGTHDLCVSCDYDLDHYLPSASYAVL
jgi:hypothetical protein